MVRPEAGQRFAHFHVYSILGRGGMGVVFSAFNVREERAVALKLLPAKHSGDTGARDRFLRESTLARTLKTPYAIEVFDAGEYDGEMWLEMPLLSGEDLHARLKREHTISPELTLSICAMTARALDDAHAIGLIHRDVKPANIFLVDVAPGEPPDAFLGDFGLTRSLTNGDPQLTTAGEILGTAHYMSPEQAECLTLGPATDIYSLACVVYRCLSGEPPYPAEDTRGAMLSHIHGEIPMLVNRGLNIGPSVDAAVRAGLAKDPAHRPPTAMALIESIRQGFAADMGRQSAPAPAAPPPPAGPPTAAVPWVGPPGQPQHSAPPPPPAGNDTPFPTTPPKKGFFRRG